MLDWLRTWRIPGLGWTPAGTLALLAAWAVGILCFLPVAALGDWLIVYQQWPEAPMMVVGMLLFGIYWIVGAEWLQDTIRRWMRARREAEVAAIANDPPPRAVASRRRRIARKESQ